MQLGLGYMSKWREADIAKSNERHEIGQAALARSVTTLWLCAILFLSLLFLFLLVSSSELHILQVVPL